MAKETKQAEKPKPQPPITSVEKANRLMRFPLRQKCRTDLMYLCHVLGYHDVSLEIHGPIMDRLQKFVGGEDREVGRAGDGQWFYVPFTPMPALKGSRRNIFLDPRGHLKTTLITIAHTVQWIINYPDVRVLISTATGDQAEGILRAVKSHFQFNDAFRTLFPEFCPPPARAADFGSRDQFIIPCRRVKHLKEPTVWTCSVGKVIAGVHPDVVKNSDLVDKENVKTPGAIREVISHFKFINPLIERYNATADYAATTGWNDVEGTRYDYGDLYGSLLKSPDWISHVRAAYKDEAGTKPLWPNRFPADELEKARREMGDWEFCTPDETPILMADWNCKRIADVEIGESVVGWDDSKLKAKLKPSKVLDKGVLSAPVIEFQMESGRIVRCTKDHYWLTGRRERKSRTDGHKRYAKAGLRYHDLKRLCFVAEPYEAPVDWNVAAWLGGIFDGEGSISSVNNIHFCQTNGKNEVVCERLRQSLRALGFDWKEYRSTPKNKKWTPKTEFVLRGGFDTTLRFARLCNPARRHEIESQLFKHCSHFIKQRDRIVTATLLPEQRVWWLTTETGNYVAWGYGSKNSAQYLNRCIPASDGLCDPQKDVAFMPKDVLDAILPRLRLHCTIDLAGMENTRSGDWTVFTVGGFDRDGRLYIIEIRCGHYSPEEVIGHIFNLHTLYPQMIDFKIEKEAHSRVLLPFLKREMAKRGRYPMIYPIKRDTHTSKQHRIRGLRPWFKTGIIRFSDGIPLNTKQELLDEIAQFPSQSYGVHDDILDTLADLMQDQEGGVTADVVADPVGQKFGEAKYPDRFLGFGEDGVATWLFDEQKLNTEAAWMYPEKQHGVKRAPTGFLD